MELKQISGQQGETLLEFYNPKNWPSQWGEMPKMMYQLIELLESIDHEQVWVFTSHAELLFTDKDDYRDWQVLVTIIEVEVDKKQQYYKVTAAQESPWHHLTGFADNHITAAELIINGLKIAAVGKGRNILLDAN